MQTGTDPAEFRVLDEIPCASDLPDGSPCTGSERVVASENSAGRTYQSVVQCVECREPTALHACFGRLSDDPETARALYKSLLAKSEEPVIDMDSKELVRRELAGLIADPCGSGNSVFIAGPCGTGKTFHGIHALADIIKKRGVSCFYLPEGLAVKAWRGSHAVESPGLARWGNAVMERARTAKVLMLDDFGQPRNTSDGALDAIEALVMHRYDAGLNVIVTTNRQIKALNESRGARVMSRMSGLAGGVVVHCTGKDWRVK